MRKHSFNQLLIALCIFDLLFIIVSIPVYSFNLFQIFMGNQVRFWNNKSTDRINVNLNVVRRNTVDTTRIKPFSTYVYTEWIFDSPPFMYSKIFLKELLRKKVVHIFTLLLAPFASKLINYSRHSKSLKNVWKPSNRCFENSVFEGKWRRFRILPKA